MCHNISKILKKLLLNTKQSIISLYAFIFAFSIKLGVIEDNSNRTRLAKLLKFFSSNSDTEQTSLAEYIERMKEKQESIFFVAGSSREEVYFFYAKYLTQFHTNVFEKFYAIVSNLSIFHICNFFQVKVMTF